MSRRLEQLDVYHTAIPMRSFEHAAARREMSQAVLAHARFDDGTDGWGECLPREYVTGETLDGVVDDLEHLLWPACRKLDFDNEDSFALLPERGPGGRCINSALCLIWMLWYWRLPWGGMAGRKITARVSGVLGSADPAKTVKRLRMMRLFGLRDFKLKLGFGLDVDAENLREVHKRIGKGVSAGKLSLRVDVNGGWDATTTPDRVAELEQYGVCVVEQPVYCGAGQLLELARRCKLPLMADESLLTAEDAIELAREPKRVWWNIRISKNGGPMAALALAIKADENHIPFTCGAMVGESGILSAAQRRFLQACPQPRFVEGNYGRFLLADDLTTRSLRFGYGGRLRALRGPGLGVRVDPRKIARYARLVRSLKV